MLKYKFFPAHNIFMCNSVIQNAALTCLAGEEDGRRKVGIGIMSGSGVARSAE